MILTPLDPCHGAILAEIHAASFVHSFDEPWSVQAFEGFLSQKLGGQKRGGQKMGGLCFGWLAEMPQSDGSIPVGFILGRGIVADAALVECEILTFAVLPEFQCQGVGRQLLDQLVQFVPAPLFLEVATSNSPAIALYQKAGFKIVGIRPDYYTDRSGKPVDAYIMTK
ncbi:MAG: N-acetyltransferase [Alphaproteobacteria bacterium]|nr:N-acetyltransferase [Alphaproteobacteria bacterium]